MIRVPLRLDPAGAFISTAKIYSLMIYPDNIEKCNELANALAADGIINLIRQRSEERFTLENWMYDCKEKGLLFIIENQSEILERKHLGNLAGGQMWRLHSLKCYYESMLADATGEHKESLKNDRGLRPSARDMRDLLVSDHRSYEEANQIKLKKYSDKELQKAWELMKPVAHFWAAEGFLSSPEVERRTQEAKANYEKENGAMSIGEEISRTLCAFLRVSKIQLFQCHGVIPHGERTPVFDKEKAFWIDSENDEWLGEVEPFLKMDMTIRQFIKQWRNKAQGAAKRGKNKALAELPS